MADKRISQLVERVTVANNDVVPIVASGASTTNKATISSIQTFMQGNLDLGVTSVGITLGTTGTNINVTGSPVTSSGNITINIPTASATNRGALSSDDWSTFNGKVSSVGLTMPSAFSVANSPITGSGTLAVTGAGTVSQYVRGDGSLADFPPGGGGGGASVSYYLNLSVSQGSIGGIAYSQMNRVPVFGAGTDTAIASNGYIASFITDAGDPALLQIPAGNWNFETFFSANSNFGSPKFYIELYKVNSGGTATLIASNSATPEDISFGTTIHAYFSALAVPTTTLTLTDRLALRYYVLNSGRTITLHTENNHLCQVITTFTTGLTALNGLTAQVQNFATGTTGTDFTISSASTTHTFNLPDASATARGVVTTGTQTFAGYKIFNGTIGANVDIQLATQGTALNTFLKNINATGQTSIGSNGFGFNNANNIYFSGSSKGGGIIAFSNTGNQTYTLQDASGTLAFTSDIPSVAGVYLPLAGGTLTGALNGTSGAFTGAVSGSAVTITATTGIAADFTNNSTTNEALRARNNGSGNIAAFRNASAEVASITNSGGLTLSGALNGTTATFSGNGSFGGAASNVNPLYVKTATDNNLRVTDAAGTLQIAVVNDAVSAHRAFMLGNGWLNFASTGAATFSSSVKGTFNSVMVGGPGNHGLEFVNATTSTKALIGGYDSTNGAYIQAVNFGIAYEKLLLNPNGGNVLIGGTSSTNSVAALQVFGSTTVSTNNGQIRINDSATTSKTLSIGVDGANNVAFLQSFQDGVAYRSLILNGLGGNVGIGTASPGVTLDVTSNVTTAANFNSTFGQVGVNFANSGTVFGSIGSGSNLTPTAGANDIGIGTAGLNNSIVFATGSGFTERMRITSGGSVLVGKNNETFSNAGAELRANGNIRGIVDGATVVQLNRLSSNGDIIEFWRSTSLVGSISVTTVGTSYNTTSDYRLKEDLQQIKGLEKVQAIKVYNYKWKSEESRMDGVLAHELAGVLPYAVIGEKDEVDEEGNDKMQGVDYSKIVPILIKAIQELKTEIDSLKNQMQ